MSTRNTAGFLRAITWPTRLRQRAKRWVPELGALEARALLTAQVTYHGNGFFPGILDHVEVSTFYWGSAWLTDPGLRATTQKLDSFYGSIANSGYMDTLNEYTGYYDDRSGRHFEDVGRGRLISSDTVNQSLSSTPVSETQIRDMLIGEVNNAHRAGIPDSNSLYIVYLPPGTTSEFAKQSGAGGYHYNFGIPTGPQTVQGVSYAVIPFPAQYAPNSANAIQLQTIIGSHELTEAVTNVRTSFGNYTEGFGTGWWNPIKGYEVGDMCEPPNLKIGVYQGFWVQAEWSNNFNLFDHRILPPGTTNIRQQGNGQGNFPAGGNGVSDSDPIGPSLPSAATPPSYSLAAGQILSVPAAAGVIPPFTDPDGLPLQAQLETQPSNGQVNLNADGSFTYSPNDGYTGQDSFTIDATDGAFQSQPTTVTLVVALLAPSSSSPTGPIGAVPPTFQWSSVPGAVNYLLSATDVTTGIPILDSVKVFGTSFTPAAALAPFADTHTYRWYVQAVDGSGNVGPSSSLLGFTISTLTVPTPSQPIGLISSTHTSFQWTTVAGATSYVLSATDLTTGLKLLDAVLVPATSYDPPGAGLVAGHAYRWTVQASGSSGNLGPVSLPVDFSISPSSHSTPGDFDSDGRADLAVFRPSTGQWLISATSAGPSIIGFGDSGLRDIPVPGDYDGVGKTELVVFRPASAQWFIQRPDGTGRVVSFGAVGLNDIPVPGDYDGDGKTDLAVFRPATGQWIISQSSGGARVVSFGDTQLRDIPVPGDYDGDGKCDLAVFRPATGQWIILQSSAGPRVVSFGASNLFDIPVPADYNGDGRADLAVYRPSEGRWLSQLSGGGILNVSFGAPNLVDLPVEGPIGSLVAMSHLHTFAVGPPSGYLPEPGETSRVLAPPDLTLGTINETWSEIAKARVRKSRIEIQSRDIQA